MPKTLYLLDAMALVYRAHFVFLKTPIRNSKGLNTSAAYGFTNTLLDLLQSRSPSHLAVVFDTAAPTARHLAYPEYKAQREEMPRELADAIPVVKDIVRAFNLRVLELDGYEADDLMGTLARRAAGEGFTTYLVTPDKDFGQLVEEHTLIYRPGRQGGEAEIWGVPQVCERWGIRRPRQVIDLLGLMGDSSDNIPGVPGIGEKTAAKLIEQFGSLENVLASTSQLKGKQKEVLEKFSAQARLSCQLATIDCDAPLRVKLDDLRVGPRNDEALRPLFQHLEFRSLTRRLFGTSTPSAPAAQTTDNGNDLPGFEAEAAMPVAEPETRNPELETQFRTFADGGKRYSIAGSPALIKQLAGELAAQPAFAFDTETSGLNPRECTLIGVSFSWEADTARWVPLPDDPARAAQLLKPLAPVFADTGIEKTGHNIKFDIAALSTRGIEVRGPLFDTMIAHALVDPDARHGLDRLSENYLGYRPIPISSLIGEKGGEQKSMLEADPRALADYAAEDADVAWQLRQVLKPLLQDKEQEDVFYRIEMPALPAIEAMERAGVALDLFALEDFSQQLGSEIQKTQDGILQLAGHPFNLNSPKQLGIVLFEELQLAGKPKKTPTGQYKTDEPTLQTLAGMHPIIEKLLAYRMMTKLKSTYVDALPGCVSPKTGRIHTTFQQAATSTGRLSSSDPNLQNIPIRTELGKEIRKAFVPSQPGWVILSADYSQIELRILAAMSGDEAMLAAFRDKEDIHRATAARVYGVKPADVDPEMRRRAKMVNFGIAYGISAFGLAQRLGIPRAEAAALIDGYFRQFPGIKRHMDATIAFCKENGYVHTLSGRRRYLPDINSPNHATRSAAERNAINMPVQGTAADLVKLAMAAVHRALADKKFQTRMLLQVHDELVFEGPEKEMPKVSKLVSQLMTGALPALSGKVPLEVETGTGPNWLEAH